MPLALALEEQLEILPEYSVNRKNNTDLGRYTFYLLFIISNKLLFFFPRLSPRSTKFTSNSQYSASRDSGLKIPKEVSRAKSVV